MRMKNPRGIKLDYMHMILICVYILIVMYSIDDHIILFLLVIVTLVLMSCIYLLYLIS